VTKAAYSAGGGGASPIWPIFVCQVASYGDGNFLELRKSEVQLPKILLLGTLVNRGHGDRRAKVGHPRTFAESPHSLIETHHEKPALNAQVSQDFV
jgi:hypothetical protein